MKKKVIVALALILTLVFTVGALTGCDEIFKKNDERDAKQVVATVSYKNQTAYVTKSELQSSFNNYAYYYTYYYGLTYQEAADYIVKSLAQRELLVLFAKEVILESYVKDGKLPAGSLPELTTLRQLLTRSEYNKAIEETNADMLTSLATVVENLYNDNKYNTAEAEKEEDTVPEDAKKIKVKFDSQGGSAVTEQEIKTGAKVTEPTDPTYTNYSFYGWYTDKACTVKFDFDTKVTAATTLYAKWVDYRTPRAAMPEEEEVDDYDADDDSESIVEEDKFFSDAYIAKLKSKETELVMDVEIDDSEFEQYVADGISELKKNIANTYHDYEYYLENEMKTLIVTKLERYVGNSVNVTAQDVEARFNRLVAENKESFNASETAFSTALTSSLATTYFHKFTVDAANSGYGFVVNILLKMEQEDLDDLTQLVKDNNLPKSVITEIRDSKLNALTVHVSNPYYDTTEEIDYNKDGKVDEDDEVIDPMTDPSNPYNGVNGTLDTEYQKEGGNDYNNILSFGKNADDKWEITYGVSECPSMAYMLNTVPAFTTGTAKGIIDQIYDSFQQVTAAVTANEMTHVESIYWLREVATAWVYLVGDDTGMTTAESNNGGLGYLITPEGEDSSYLEDFTTLARGLIKNGTGSYSIDGTATRNNFYTFADSFIESGSTSNGYAGIFILLCSYKTWDTSAFRVVENEGVYTEVAATGDNALTANADGTGILPYNYVVTYGKTLEDCVTVGEQIKTDLETGMKSDAYNLKANTFGVQNAGNIVYNEKIYKSLWKDLE